MKRTSLWLLCSMILLMLMAACSPPELPASPTGEVAQPGAAETATVEPTTTAPEPATEIADDPGTETPQPQQMETLVRQDLAERLGLVPDEIELVSQEAVEWPDAALGCPLPDVAYAQVITPGFEIVLQAGGERYEYHTDRQQRFVLCKNGEPQLPSIPIDPGDIDDGEPWMPVDPPPATEETP